VYPVSPRDGGTLVMSSVNSRPSPLRIRTLPTDIRGLPTFGPRKMILPISHLCFVFNSGGGRDCFRGPVECGGLLRVFKGGEAGAVEMDLGRRRWSDAKWEVSE